MLQLAHRVADAKVKIIPELKPFKCCIIGYFVFLVFQMQNANNSQNQLAREGNLWRGTLPRWHNDVT